jgi:hypothetical protein
MWVPDEPTKGAQILRGNGRRRGYEWREHKA